MAGEKPMGAVALAVLGGVVNIVFGVLLFLGRLPALLGPALVSPLSLLSIVCGAIVAVSALTLLASAKRSKTLGYVIILVSLPTIFAVLGFLLGLLGGLMSVRWKPPAQGESPPGGT